MTDALPDPPDLDPAALAASEFTRTRRGLEPTEVRASLGRAADALRTWRARDEHHRRTIEQLRGELDESKELDESRIVSVLGEETARIVSAARDAAAEIRTKAEEQAARLLAETDAQATAAAEALTTEATRLRDDAAALHDQAVADAARLRAEAESEAASTLEDARTRSEDMLARAETVLAERTAEAEQHAATLTDAATRELTEAHASAGAIRAAAESDAEQIVEDARATGRQMIAEVREARERMLADLAERRRAARRRIEAALAGRDRIVDVLNEASQHVASTIESLERVDEDANAAAEVAASSVEDVDEELDALREALESNDPTEGVVEETDGPEELAAEDDGAAEDGEADPAAQGAAAEVEPAEVEPAEVEPAEVEPAEVEAEEEDESADRDGATVHDLFERIRAEGIDAADGATTSEEASEGDERADAGSAATREETDQPAPADEPEVDAAAAADAEIDLTDGPDDSGQRTDADLLDRRDELLAPVEKQVARVLKRLVSDQQNEVLDRLRRHKRGRPDPEELLPAADPAAVDAWADALGAEFGAAVEAGSTFWAEVAGSSVTVLFDDDAATAVLHERLAGVMTLYRAHFERVLTGSEERGEDTGELSARVSAAYRDWRSSVLPEVVGDLVTAGFAHGERRAAGPGTPWRWLVDNGGLPCADGEDNSLGGAVPCEEPFPTGDLTPPAHPGCRCLLAPADR